MCLNLIFLMRSSSAIFLESLIKSFTFTKSLMSNSYTTALISFCKYFEKSNPLLGNYTFLYFQFNIYQTSLLFKISVEWFGFFSLEIKGLKFNNYDFQIKYSACRIISELRKFLFIFGMTCR